MVRWLRIACLFVVVLALIGAGAAVGLFILANNDWVAIAIPPWFQGWLGQKPLEAWLPALIGGWVVAVLAVLALWAWSLFYVWRRRQYERLVARLERELADLRNLPFLAPAPLEDLPDERPNGERADALAVLAEAGGEGDRDPWSEPL
ncbi:MAG TPA: hypothetical protein VFG83_11275 [Kofleriaceae bacterium]|nr:hypothetical protein [Kofleriaceae bacterium]